MAKARYNTDKYGILGDASPFALRERLLTKGVILDNKVYVVMDEIQYEAGELKRVFPTRSKAVSYAKKQAEGNLAKHDFTVYACELDKRCKKIAILNKGNTSIYAGL